MEQIKRKEKGREREKERERERERERGSLVSRNSQNAGCNWILF